MYALMKKLLMASLVLGLGASAYGNLLLNPSFEDGDGGWLPDTDIEHWNPFGITAGFWTDDPEEVYDGDRAVLVWGVHHGLWQSFDAQSDVLYDFSLMAQQKSNEMLNEHSRLDLGVEWYEADNSTRIGDKIILDSLTEASGGGTWTE